jgi:hypothetical protein
MYRREGWVAICSGLDIVKTNYRNIFRNAEAGLVDRPDGTDR